MKKFPSATFVKKAALTLILSALLIPASIAQGTTPRFAVVDMKKVFDSYYKTKQAEAQIKDRAADSDKVYKGMVDDYQKANEDYRKLIESSNDQAVSAEERDKRKKAAESKLMEIQEIEKSVKQFQAQARTTIGEMEKRMRDSIVQKIREIVDARAKAGGYMLVFDTAAQTVYQTPFILYTNGENDLTDGIVKELNADAPAGALSATEPAPNN